MRFKQRADFFVQVISQVQQLFLPLAALLLQPLPFAGLGQAIATLVEQLGGATEEAAVGQNIAQGPGGLGDAAVFLFLGAEVALLDLVLGQQQLSTPTGLFQQQHGGGGPQVGLGHPYTAVLGRERQPVFDLVLLDRQLFLQHLEHRLITSAVGVEAVTQTQCLAWVFQHAGIGQAAGV